MIMNKSLLLLIHISVFCLSTVRGSSSCGSCTGCLWVTHGVCYDGWSVEVCNRYADYTYCGNIVIDDSPDSDPSSSTSTTISISTLTSTSSSTSTPQPYDLIGETGACRFGSTSNKGQEPEDYDRVEANDEHDCKLKCSASKICIGVEVNRKNGHCELWKKEADFVSSSDQYKCYKKLNPDIDLSSSRSSSSTFSTSTSTSTSPSTSTSTSTSTSQSYDMIGETGACRYESATNKGLEPEDYDRVEAIDDNDCKNKCTASENCIGVETNSNGHCELWKKEADFVSSSDSYKCYKKVGYTPSSSNSDVLSTPISSSDSALPSSPTSNSDSPSTPSYSSDSPTTSSSSTDKAWVTYHFYKTDTLLTKVSCSDGTNGLITRWSYTDLSSMFPYVAAVSGHHWNSPKCGSCYKLEDFSTQNTVYVTAIDQCNDPSEAHQDDGYNYHFDMAYPSFIELFDYQGFLD
eukprot:Awhi_evm1s13535